MPEKGSAANHLFLQMIVIVEFRQGILFERKNRLDDSAILPYLFSQDWTPIDEAQYLIVALLLDENNLPLTLPLHQKSLSLTIGLEVDRSTTKDLW